MRRLLEQAGPADAEALAALSQLVAADLTTRHGKGPWSSCRTVKAVLLAMKRSTVFVARRRNEIVGTVSLGTRKPWAIDPRYFTPCARPLYLTVMAIAPPFQGQGLGRRCLREIQELGHRWKADSIRLDAFDAPTGAGGFYQKSGFREVGRVIYRGTPLRYYEFLLQG